MFSTSARFYAANSGAMDWILCKIHIPSTKINPKSITAEAGARGAISLDPKPYSSEANNFFQKRASRKRKIFSRDVERRCWKEKELGAPPMHTYAPNVNIKAQPLGIHTSTKRPFPALSLIFATALGLFSCTHVRRSQKDYKYESCCGDEAAAGCIRTHNFHHIITAQINSVGPRCICCLTLFRLAVRVNLLKRATVPLPNNFDNYLRPMFFSFAIVSLAETRFFILWAKKAIYLVSN